MTKKDQYILEGMDFVKRAFEGLDRGETFTAEFIVSSIEIMKIRYTVTAEVLEGLNNDG